MGRPAHTIRCVLRNFTCRPHHHDDVDASSPFSPCRAHPCGYSRIKSRGGPRLGHLGAGLLSPLVHRRLPIAVPITAFRGSRRVRGGGCWWIEGAQQLTVQQAHFSPPRMLTRRHLSCRVSEFDLSVQGTTHQRYTSHTPPTHHPHTTHTRFTRSHPGDQNTLQAEYTQVPVPVRVPRVADI